MAKRKVGGGSSATNDNLESHKVLRYYGFAGVAVLLAALLYKMTMTTADQGPGIQQPWHYTVVKSGVRRVVWSSDRRVVQPMLEGKEPRILTNTFAAQWPAATSRQWSPSYLATRLPERCEARLSRAQGGAFV